MWINRNIPKPLDVLSDLAADLHWSWNHSGDALWRKINPGVWDNSQNPMSVLQLTSDAQFKLLAEDEQFLQELQTLVKARQDYMSTPAWYEKNHTDKPIKGIAYFSMEFGLCEALPLYAGGLGILAGDYLKTASDLGVPLIGIGLLYQQGYFHQSFNDDGWQQQTYLLNDPGSLPIQPLLAEDGSWLYIDTQFLCRSVRFRVWQAQVGRVKLYLLDSNDQYNQPRDRGITGRLYGGNTEMRLMQEIALGICGWRLIEKLGLEIDVCHLNEGHAAFATLERINAYIQKHSVDFWQALWATRIGNIFTTHTAVAAGFDVYPEHLVRRYIGEIAYQLGITVDILLSLGRANHINPDNHFSHNSQQINSPQTISQQTNTQEPFNMAYLAMHTCANSNAVSRLHGDVSRRIFQPLYPRWPEREIPITHVTNGVHVPTWDSVWADEEWTRIFGKERWRGDIDALTPVDLNALSDAQLWQIRVQGRSQLIDYARQRFTSQTRHEFTFPYCEVAPDIHLDPNILTLGFARRFAEYKRADLLLHDPDRLARILGNSRYPVQLIVAGKSHPADDLGKYALQRWQQFIQRADVHRHVVFIDDYDIALAQQLVQGVDVWINTPRRPWEACGTSGMKVLVNGGLNVSTLDGWWAEAYMPNIGWAIGDGLEHGSGDNNDNDAQDAEQLYQLLENEIVPLFYKRDSNGLAEEWIHRIRTSMSELTTRFSSNRMIQEYINQLYIPAAKGLLERTANGGELANHLQRWDDFLKQHWHEIHIDDLSLTSIENKWHAEVTVYLGGIHPQSLRIQVIADPIDQQPALCINLALLHPVDGAIHAYRFAGELPNNRSPKDFTVRAISAHPQANIPAENALIYWQTVN